jgi:hypothetical protein
MSFVRTRRHLGITLVGAAIAAGVIVGTAAASTDAPPPGLSVTIDNGITHVSSDTDTTYTTTVANAGTDPVAVTVVVTVPPFAKPGDAPGATVEGANATWTLTVDPGTNKSVTMTAHVAAIPKGTYRVTTVASVYLGDTAAGAPVIRSADADKIPGVKDPIVTSGRTPAPAASSTGSYSWVLPVGITGVIVILLLTVLFMLWRNRRRPRRRRGGSPFVAAAHDASGNPEHPTASLADGDRA